MIGAFSVIVKTELPVVRCSSIHNHTYSEAAHSNKGGEQAENFINFYLLSVSENAKNNKMPLIQL